MRKTIGLCLVVVLSCLAQQLTADTSRPRSVADVTSGAKKIDGYVPLFWNESTGRLYMEISRLDEEMIWQVTLASGVGSNPIGLDRGQLGRTHLVTFRRVGPKILLVQRNPRFDARSSDPLERRAVAESFASSVVWGFKVEAESQGRVIVDATDFFLSDAHGVARSLRRAEQGAYSVDATRSTIWPEGTKGFPRNTEVEALLTLTTSDRPGGHVSSVAPTPEIVTVRQRHSLVQLPPAGFEPRKYDPRVAAFSLEIYDYASPIGSPIETRFAERHRIHRKDPLAAMSEPVEPIVYYVDPGAPLPVRQALIEGASWWNEAFEAAGFIDGFQVRELPAGADPMDVRYNIIHWTHRSTRGWSYGGGVVDPRTGEILKGNVNLGSLRVRQDILLAHGLVPHFGGPDGEALASLGDPSAAERMALARIRQLSAHEVGHAIGLAHNFAASTYGRASVMDYPAPMVEIRDGELDLSNAYGVGIGPFDEFAAKWLYSELPPGTDVEAALDRIVAQGEKDGMLYVADDHARPIGAPHPLGSLWDNGADPVERLAHEMEVRRIALGKFGLASIANGMPLSTLEERLMPLYLHHRYQLEAAVKSLGGVHFTYAVKSRGSAVPADVRRIEDPAKQRRALQLAMQTLEPSFLKIPDSIVALIPPVEPEWADGTGERFPKRTGGTLDPLAAAAT
jgi:hypothetical protein